MVTRAAAAALLLLGAAACDAPTDAGPEAARRVTVTRETAAGGGYAGDEYVASPRTVRVFVSDELELGVRGATVRFVAGDGAGSFEPAEAVTNELGEVVTVWTPGTRAGRRGGAWR